MTPDLERVGAALALAGWPLATALAGTAGGGLAILAGVPLGWLIGSMASAAALCCIRSRAGVPRGLRYVGQLIIGISAGLSFTPPLLAHVLAFAPAILLAVAASIAMGVALSGLLARFGRLDRTTAFFASMPGGVAEMSNLAERYGGEVAPVAVAQTLRIFLAVLAIPLLARALGHGGSASAFAASRFLSVPAMAAAATASFCAATVLSRWRVPNAWLLGAIAVGALVALAGDARFHLPAALLALAQVLVGTSLGARLRREALRAHARLVPVTMLATGLLLAGNVAIGLLLSALTGAGPTTTTLGTSPGGLAEMGLTAIALKADVGLVTAFHLARTLVVALVSVPLNAAIEHRWRRSIGRSGT